MGLLTDPGVGHGRITYILVNYHNKLCVLLYIVAVAWFMLLAHDHFNAGTYFSENALLPGLVRSDFDEDGTAKRFQSELLTEAANHPNSVPYAWISAKFRQLNLDTYLHNFTLNYPLGNGNLKYTGKNVYAILRAPRSSSTEALVLSVPYRPPSSVLPTTVPSIALTLALAKFFRRQKYWAKDIIFLVTEHEQLGVQAWLEAYHQTSCGTLGVLDHGDLEGRGGAIQAAINLQLHSDRIGHMDIKVEGLNGQLPNLDLVNLAHRMCSKEGVRHTFKGREPARHADQLKSWAHSFTTLSAMIATQATGAPSGSHGLFHRFGIESITLEGFEKTDRGSPAVFYQMGRVMEGLFRSLNNLLERFHQSFFFYLLPSTDRYISIGAYMPPLGLLCASLLIKAFALWLNLQDDPFEEDPDNKATDKGEEARRERRDAIVWSIVPVGITVLTTHAVCVLLLSSPQWFCSIGLQYDLPTDMSIYIGYCGVSLFDLVVAAGLRKYVTSTVESRVLLNIIALLELATLLLAVGMTNFSLALLTAVIYIPQALCMAPSGNRWLRRIRQGLWLLLHPLALLTLVGMVMAGLNFPEEGALAIVGRGFYAARHALVLSVVDAAVYGSYLWSLAVAALLPTWMLFWFVSHAQPSKTPIGPSKLKMN